MDRYLEVMGLLNFLVVFLLLTGTNALAGLPAEPGRCALAAGAAGIYSRALLLPGLAFLGKGLWQAGAFGVVALTAFGWNRSFWKRSGLFLLLWLALGGMAASVEAGDWVSLALGALAVWLVSLGALEGGGSRYVPVQLTYRDRQASLIALKDTGNTLRDPVTGEQVLVIGSEVAQRLTGLTREQLRQPIATLTSRALPGLRLIPFQSIGCSHGLLLAVRMDQVQIGNRQKSTLVAFAPEGLGEGRMYQALTGGCV